MLGDAINWWEGSLHLFQVNNTNLNTVKKEFLSEASIRGYAKELFSFCLINQIPITILSAGIKEIIEVWCKKYNVRPTRIVATELQTEENGRIIGWQKDTLVHILNKKEKGAQQLSDIAVKRPLVVLIGDSPADGNMVEGEENVIRILINDRHIAPQKKAPLFQEFDVTVQNGNLQPILDFLTSLSDPKIVKKRYKFEHFPGKNG